MVFNNITVISYCWRKPEYHEGFTLMMHVCMAVENLIFKGEGRDPNKHSTY
jgi:hypothetical protein